MVLGFLLLKVNMSIKNRFDDSSNWILNEPESLVILILMGTGMSSIFFGLLAYVFGMGASWILMVLFALFSLASIKYFIKLIKMVKKFGIKQALSGITANEFVWHKNKYGGIEDGSNGSIEADEVGSGGDAKKNKRIRGEVGHIYRQSK